MITSVISASAWRRIILRHEMVSTKQSARNISRCFGNLHLARRGPALLEMECLDRGQANVRPGHSRAEPFAGSDAVSRQRELPEIAGVPRDIQCRTGQIQRRAKIR